MSYFQTDDIPSSPPTNPKPLLTLISPKGDIIMSNVKSFRIRLYYRDNYGIKAGINGKRVWRGKLALLGYKIENT